MKVSDLPSDLLAKIDEEFESQPKVRELRTQVVMLQRSNRWADALTLARRLEEMRNRCVWEYIRESENAVERIDLTKMDIPKSDKDAMISMMLVCFMCADIIETSVLDINDLIHRYDKDINVEMFNDMRQVMAMAKEKLKYLQESGDYMKGMVWGDKCDDMYDMMKSKARSIMRKQENCA